jgi:hypothetical protein
MIIQWRKRWEQIYITTDTYFHVFHCNRITPTTKTCKSSTTKLHALTVVTELVLVLKGLQTLFAHMSDLKSVQMLPRRRKRGGKLSDRKVPFRAFSNQKLRPFHPQLPHQRGFSLVGILRVSPSQLCQLDSRLIHSWWPSPIPPLI